VAPLLGLSATLQPQETSAKTAQVGGETVDDVIIRGEINRNNCLDSLGRVSGNRVMVSPCLDNPVQTSWFFHNGTLGNSQGPWCVGVSGNHFMETLELVVASCDHIALRWELAGGKFKAKAYDNLCLDAQNGPNTPAVLRGCAAEVGPIRDPRRTDQYWDLVPTVG
jgi:hypothetical protein